MTRLDINARHEKNATMNIMKTVLILAFAAAILSFASCKKGGSDLSKFAETCARVVQCDASFSAVPDAQNNCQKFMGAIEQKLPAVMPQFTECLMNTPCEKLSFQECGATHMEKVKGLMP